MTTVLLQDLTPHILSWQDTLGFEDAKNFRLLWWSHTDFLPCTIEFRISNGTNYLAHGRSEAKMQDQRSLREFRSLRTVFRSIALRSARPSGALLERARSV